MTLRLPLPDGGLTNWRPSEVEPIRPEPGGFSSRVAFAAAHVVADPLADANPDESAAIDWGSTIEYRRYLWSMGFGVAEAMDTAQRGSGLDWHAASQLISRTLAEAKADGGALVCAVGSDQLIPGPAVDGEAILEAYRQQLQFVEGRGGRVMLMASRALAAWAQSADDYLDLYGRLLEEVSAPVMIHWLGEMFDPALSGYWGSKDPWTGLTTLLQLIDRHPDKVDGVKISLLDPELERALRSGLPRGVRVYTGDDFNYLELILGDERGHSDALLGILDMIAPVAAAALQALDADDHDRYRVLLEPTVPLARHVFSAPTFHYKTGLVFLAYLNGHQNHFKMLEGAESARSLPHLGQVMVLADRAGLLRDPELATYRMGLLLTLAGLE